MNVSKLNNTAGQKDQIGTGRMEQFHRCGQATENDRWQSLTVVWRECVMSDDICSAMCQWKDCCSVWSVTRLSSNQEAFRAVTLMSKCHADVAADQRTRLKNTIHQLMTDRHTTALLSMPARCKILWIRCWHFASKITEQYLMPVASTPSSVTVSDTHSNTGSVCRNMLYICQSAIL